MRKLALLFVLALLAGCATRTPQKAAADSLFLTGKAVNDAYAAYLDGIFAHTIKTNSFPKVSGEYQVFQQLFAVTVAEFPSNTNGLASVVIQGAAVITDVNLAKKGTP